MIDVLFLCHGRLEFTKASLTTLIQNTDWDQVNQLVIYNDAAPDHPATYDWLDELYLAYLTGPPDIDLRNTNLGSPVAVMNHFLARTQADIFAKIDNDVIVPAGWLETMLTVMVNDPTLELLGMQPGMGSKPPDDWNMRSDADNYGYVPSDHIGGVGLMRSSAFRTRPAPTPDGRFGFTEWQHTYNPTAGWINPDLPMFGLDFLPIEPWVTLTAGYAKIPGLQREWPKYDLGMSWCWEWWL